MRPEGSAIGNCARIQGNTGGSELTRAAEEQEACNDHEINKLDSVWFGFTHNSNESKKSEHTFNLKQVKILT